MHGEVCFTSDGLDRFVFISSLTNARDRADSTVFCVVKCQSKIVVMMY